MFILFLLLFLSYDNVVYAENTHRKYNVIRPPFSGDTYYNEEPLTRQYGEQKLPSIGLTHYLRRLPMSALSNFAKRVQSNPGTSVSGWKFFEKQADSKREGYLGSYVNKKDIRGLGYVRKEVEKHIGERDGQPSEYVIPVVRLNLYALTTSDEDVTSAKEACEEVEKVLAALTNEEAREQILAIANALDFSSVITIPAKTPKNDTTPVQPKRATLSNEEALTGEPAV